MCACNLGIGDHRLLHGHQTDVNIQLQFAHKNKNSSRSFSCSFGTRQATAAETGLEDRPFKLMDSARLSRAKITR